MLKKNKEEITMKTKTIELTQTKTMGLVYYGLRLQNGLSYPFISPVKEDTIKLQQQMSEEDISPVHFNDIVADYLYMLYDRSLKANGLKA